MNKAIQKNRQVRNCPVCGSKRSKMLFQQRFSMISDVSIIDGYNVVVCKDCGFGFADNIPEQSVFNRYYKEMSKYEYQHRGGQESEYNLARFRAISNTIQQFIPNKKSQILEVGCATGTLLYLLKNNGYQNVLGLDPSLLCVKTAKQLYGIRVLTGTIPNASFPKETFDFLILTGVLEHIRELKLVLSWIKGVLSKNGLVYIEVPNALQFIQYPNAPFQQFSIEHINFFSDVSLANLMKRNSFDCVFHHQNVRKLSHKVRDPAISAIFKKNEQLRSQCAILDKKTEHELKRYIARSKKAENYLYKKLDKIITGNKPIIVWGVGTHTLRLLATSKLSQVNICAFVDSNPKYQGKRLNGIPIIAPFDLKDMSESILILSYVFQWEIQKQIRDELKCDNELLLLY